MSQRSRYEHISEQFNSFAGGEDALLSLQTRIWGHLRYGDFSLFSELLDARIMLHDDSTPIDERFVNTTDLLSAYFSTSFSDLSFNLGRMAINFGSGRLHARHAFDNAINSFTGLDVTNQSAHRPTRRWAFRAFATVPVMRRPDSLTDLRANQFKLDKEDFGSLFAGAQIRSPRLFDSMRGEAYLFALKEKDGAFSTKNRDLITPGIRYLTEKVDSILEIEVAAQTGSSRLSTGDSDTADLEHFAYFGHLQAGVRRFEDLPLGFALLLDYSSGDQDPTDALQGAFDPLFGSSYSDFGPSGIYSHGIRSGLASLGLRLFAGQDKDLNLQLTGRRRVNTTGDTGGKEGYQFDAFLHWHEYLMTILDRSITSTLEAGLTRIIFDAPPSNISSAPTYAFIQLALSI